MAFQHSRGVQPVPLSPFALLLAQGQEGINRGFEMARQTQAEAKRGYYRDLELAAMERRNLADERFRRAQARRNIFEADRSFTEGRRQFDAQQGLAREQMAQSGRLSGLGHIETMAEIEARRDQQIEVLREKARLEQSATPPLPSGGIFGQPASLFDHARAANQTVEFLGGMPAEEQVGQIQSLQRQNREALARTRSLKEIAEAAGNTTAKNFAEAEEAQLLAEQDIYDMKRTDLTVDLAHQAKLRTAENARRKQIMGELEQARSTTRRIDSKLKDLDLKSGKSRRPDLDGSEKNKLRAQLQAEKADALAEERAIEADLKALDERRQVGPDGLLPPKGAVPGQSPLSDDPDDPLGGYFDAIEQPD